MVYKTQDRKKYSAKLGAPEEYVGYGLCDPRGRGIGRVERLFVNDYDEPEYIEVKTGLFGRKAILIPVTDVAVDEDKKTIVLQ